MSSTYCTRFTSLLESLEPAERAALLRVATTFAGPAGFLRIGDLPPAVELERLRRAIRESVPTQPKERPFITRVRRVANEISALACGMNTLARLAHGDWRGSDTLGDALLEAAAEMSGAAEELIGICDEPARRG